jgi:hypothetical protein
MRRLLPPPNLRQPPVRRQEVASVAADVASIAAAPVVTTAASAAFSAEQAISGAPTGAKFLRDDYTWQAPAATGGGNGVEVTVSFGASFTEYASTVVTGQAWVTGTSKIVVTASSTAAEAQDALLHGFRFAVTDLVVGNGFTLHVHAPVEAKGDYTFFCIGV